MVQVSRTNVTPTTTGAWVDVDVSAYVDAGNTALVVLEIVNTSTTEYNWGIRKNGSTDDIRDIIEEKGHTWAAIGVDSSDIFEAYIQNTAIQLYLVAYATSDEAGNLTNAVDLDQDVEGAWTDIDISSHTGADTAKVAFFLVNQVYGTYMYGFRQNGSTDDRKADIFNGDLRGAMMSVDANEILEYYSEYYEVDIWLVGWLKDNVSSWANAKDYSTATTGSYVDVDFSTDIPAGGNGAFVHFYGSTNAEYSGNIRKNGETSDSYYDISNHQYLWTEIDSSRIAEQKIENTALDLYLWGYTTTAGGQTYYQSVGGTLTSAGTLTAIPTFTQLLSGSLSFSGTLSTVITITKNLAGYLNFQGNLTKKIIKTLSGALSFSGSLSEVFIGVLSLAGSISFSGALSKTITFCQSLSGILTFAGSVAGKAIKATGGVLSFTGELSRKIYKNLSGVLSFSGSLSYIRIYSKSLQGTISFAGSLTKQKITEGFEKFKRILFFWIGK